MRKEIRLRALENQIQRLERRLERLHRTSDRYSWIRLVVFVAGLVASSTAFMLTGPPPFVIGVAVTLAVFGTVVYYHRQIDESIARHETWLQIKSAQVARMRLDWTQISTSDLGQPRYDHPFEADLDLFGERSIHQLLDTAVSRDGSRRLREWLTAPVPDPEQTIQRQRIVRELTPRVLFRDKLILNAKLVADAGEPWDAGRLIDWLERRTPARSLRRWLLLFSALAALNIALFLLSRFGLIPPIWRVTLIFYFGLFLARAELAGAIFEDALTLQKALQQLIAVFKQLETHSYRDTPHLEELCEVFLSRQQRPSQHLKRVARVVTATGVRGNPAVWLILNGLVPWDFFFAYRLSQHKANLAQQIPVWINVWFELEALSSLANFAYLNPGYTLPDIVADKSEESSVVFRTRALGHPLIPDDERVCNDFAIDELGEIAIITGSNMAGKSTFLRTVGVNLALAYAGGPVNAEYLLTLPFRMFTCVKVSDSVTDGISYFYAEVKCLRALLAELERHHPLPVLFCIDEIFRGTNNRERLIGSRAYVRALIGKRGSGLIATHDLELVKLAGESPQIKNYHFQDAVSDGRMVFDYVMRAGPCPTTNALKIMRMEGLPVPPIDDSQTEMTKA